MAVDDRVVQSILETRSYDLLVHETKGGGRW